METSAIGDVGIDQAFEKLLRQIYAGDRTFSDKNFKSNTLMQSTIAKKPKGNAVKVNKASLIGEPQIKKNNCKC